MRVTAHVGIVISVSQRPSKKKHYSVRCASGTSATALAECSVMPHDGHAPDLTTGATADIDKVRRAGGDVRVAVATRRAWWNLEPRLAPTLHGVKKGVSESSIAAGSGGMGSLWMRCDHTSTV
jgi:hypothetical protein